MEDEIEDMMVVSEMGTKDPQRPFHLEGWYY